METPDNEVLLRAVAAVADAIYVIDQDGRATFANPAALAILGYDEKEILGRPSHETIHYRRPDGSPYPKDECPLVRPLFSGETVRGDQDAFIRKDGSLIPIAYSSAPVTLTDGKGAVVAFHDISERMRLGEVEASRARISRAADHVRRIIERDLHDGAQQQFITIALELEHIRSVIGINPETAERLLEHAQKDLLDAIEQLRRLAHGIYPAVLSERGLVAALRSLARQAMTMVHVKADDIGRLPPDTEMTAYFIVAEAVTNVVKHAQADHVEIALARTPRVLRLTVMDDGVGGATFGAGTGLQGLRDRADAVGGRLSLESPIGGPTVISLELPMHGEPGRS
ncbi:PAS domain S-box protein [Planotetraspora thailandica]|nr:PAS domain S-box protein [Planotetraspora thailandica]